jgi:hypothetical protein
MKYRTLLVALAVLALATLACGPCGAISELVGGEGVELPLPVESESEDETPAPLPEATVAPEVEAPEESPEEEATEPEPVEGGSSAGAIYGDIPVYPGASETLEQVTPPFGADEGDYALTEFWNYETSDEPAKVSDFYLAEMPNRGWEKIVEMPMDEAHMSVWAKEDEGLGATIVIAETDEGMTYITIIVGQEE